MSWPRASDPAGGGRLPTAWSIDANRRAANVDRIRASLDDGTYEVAAQDVAKAIIAFYARPSDSGEPEVDSGSDEGGSAVG